MKLLNKKNLSTLISHFSFQKGFTLIELLVVIAVLGVLAAAVVAAIDPVKKINTAKDSNIKNDISSIANAMQAYYTATNANPTLYYPSTVADLVPNELKIEPKNPDGISYTMAVSPAGCTTALKTCTNIAVSTAMKNPLTAGNVWCWRSSTNVVAEIAVAACTAP